MLEASPRNVVVTGGGTGIGRAAPDENDLAGLVAAWRANLDANLLPAVLMTAALAPRFEPDARIVTLGSIAARWGAGSYGAAKAAVEAWTADVASELGPRGITGRCRGGDFPGLPRRRTHHGPDHPRQWRCVSRAVTGLTGGRLALASFATYRVRAATRCPGGLYGDAE